MKESMISRFFRADFVNQWKWLDEEDEGYEAYHHEQYGMLQPVFEIACCHLSTHHSREQCFYHGHVQEYRGNLVKWETNEAEPSPESPTAPPASAKGRVGQLFEEARYEEVDCDEEYCEADVHDSDERSQSGAPRSLQVLDLLHVLGDGVHAC